MDVDLALLADAATIDASGKLNILGIFDRLGTSSFPAQHPHMVLILRFTAGVSEMGTHQVEIALKDPKGEEVVHIDGEMHIGPGSRAGERVKVPQVLNLDGIVFPVAGRYAFDVRVDGDHHVSVPLLVSGPATGGADA
ncbi:MAG: hypothetical protein PVJ02_00080 [Gemmatimonadota bacterium]|jgi:hypothetical protein